MIRWCKRVDPKSLRRVPARDGSILAWPHALAPIARLFDDEDPYAREIGGEA